MQVTAGAAGVAGASVTTLRGLVAAQQEQDTSDGVGCQSVCAEWLQGRLTELTCSESQKAQVGMPEIQAK